MQKQCSIVNVYLNCLLLIIFINFIVEWSKKFICGRDLIYVSNRNKKIHMNLKLKQFCDIIFPIAKMTTIK